MYQKPQICVQICGINYYNKAVRKMSSDVKQKEETLYLKNGFFLTPSLPGVTKLT